MNPKNPRIALSIHRKVCLTYAAILLAHHRILLVFCGVLMELDSMSESNGDMVGNEDFAGPIPG